MSLRFSYKILQSSLISACRNYRVRRSYEPGNIVPGDYPHFRWQVPACGLKPYEERVKEVNSQESRKPLQNKVDIGLPYDKPQTTTTKAVQKRPELEKAARKRTLLIDLDEVEKENQTFPLRAFDVSCHYGIFDDLFGHPHCFVPKIPLNLNFKTKDGNFIPVVLGNRISPQNAGSEPLLDVGCLPDNSFWTVIMTSPDEPFARNSNDKTKSGDTLVPYLQPIPYAGTGFHRYIFTLYLQLNGKMDQIQLGQHSLKGDPNLVRGFSTRQFYAQYEEQLTPASLRFFQSAWDDSVRNCFRQVLDTTEPIFEVKWPEAMPPPQSRHPRPNSWHYPRRHPLGHPHMTHRLAVHEDLSFDVYLDRYRDRKEMMQEIVEARLKREGNPLDPNETSRQTLIFPMAEPMPKEFPSWRRQQEVKRRLRQGRWRELDGYEQES
ncbi:39S ribosomal protein L38, mitochondrial [Cichlidogyrus casuarinus]|uniref:39S ribosomal protein L38, mitochondrial n=1 Tax=Cichlidogyrus casuarinus TaxID=1844966 RepID=A0ABD2PSF7_9PLAT